MGVKIYRIVVQRADIADISLIGNKKKVQQLIRQAKSAGYDLLSVSAGYREGTNTHTHWHWYTRTHTGTGANTHTHTQALVRMPHRLVKTWQALPDGQNF